jgi:predicted transcriptional regulator
MPTEFMKLLIITLLIFLLLGLLMPAVSATEYTVRPSLNMGKEPGSSVYGEAVEELQPIPSWLAVVFLLFPHMTSLPMELLITLKGFSCLGFKQITNNNALKNSNRNRLYCYIKDNPGVYFREIEKNCDINRGTLDYHLKILEFQKIVTAYSDNNKKRFFPANSLNSDEIKLISILQSDRKKNILSAIYLSKTATNGDIAEITCLSASTVSRYTSELKDLGVISGETDGKTVRYTVSNKYQNKLSLLLKDFHPANPTIP